MNKKGVSPLIATVLIIGFTAVLAIIVMVLGDSLNKRNIEQANNGWSMKELKCINDVDFSINQKSCVNESLLSLNVYNIGESTITKLYIKKKGIGRLVNTGMIELKSLYEEGYNFTIDCSINQEFEIYPAIIFNNKEEICLGSVKNFVPSS